MDTVSARILGHIAGVIRRTQYVVDVAADPVARHKSDAGRYRKFIVMPFEAVGADEREYFFGHAPGLRQRTVFHEYTEFIAAQPGQRITGSDLGTQQFTQLSQHGITGQVTAGIVDDLEVIQVDIANSVSGYGHRLFVK